MDLRPCLLSADAIAQARALLAYQPFVISDTVCTGAAYNWLYAKSADEWTGPEVYDRAVVGAETFAAALDASVRMRTTYERFLGAICRAFPGGSYLDVACNTGWFPVMASLNGMSDCTGLDPGDYGAAVSFLNRVTGAHATFIRGGYASPTPVLASGIGPDRRPFDRQFDVVSNFAFMGHLGDPLQFLQALTSVARKAVFIWTGLLDVDDYIIRFSDPVSQPPPGFEGLTWSRFSYGTSISALLLFTMMDMLGFAHRFEVKDSPQGLGTDWYAQHPERARYGKPRAFLFVREPYAEEVRARLLAA